MTRLPPSRIAPGLLALDVSEQVGLDQSLGKGMGVAIADYDGDGRMDVFVTNDLHVVEAAP